MATNHVLPSARLDGGQVATPKASAALAIIALLLALVLGFSAADIQNQRLENLSAAGAVETDASIRDGRGKWGGYF